MSKKLGAAGLVLFSLLLGVTTWFAFGALSYLPYSPVRDAVSDAVTSPGGLLASIFYPQGIHTGFGSPGAIYIALGGNVVVYAVVWFLLILVVRRAGPPLLKQLKEGR